MALPLSKAVLGRLLLLFMASYTVVKGDTLFSIARRFGLSVIDLQKINNMVSPNLRVGQVLQVSKTTTPNPTPPPAPPNPTPTWPTAPNPNPNPTRPAATWPTGNPTTPTPTPPPPAPTVTANFLTNRQQFSVQVRPDVGCQRFILTVPLLNGQTIQANMRDNVTLSRFMVYPNGILYGGQSQIPINLQMIESVGLTESQARALQWVSTHEGKFDAINSYDRAIFSYGFIQFVGALAHGASLNRVLASMKQFAPDQFARIFQSVGIDSESNVTTVLSENGTRLRGDDAWFYIQKTVPLYGAFVQAGFEPAHIREQLRMANALYVQPALNFKMTLQVGGLTLAIPRLQDVLSSEAILTAVIALAINQGTGGMSRIFSTATATVAAQQGLNNYAALSRIDQRRVCQEIVSTSSDERVRARVQGVLDSGLSFG